MLHRLRISPTSRQIVTLSQPRDSAKFKKLDHPALVFVPSQNCGLLHRLWEVQDNTVSTIKIAHHSLVITGKKSSTEREINPEIV